MKTTRCRRGTILIVTMCITFLLAGMALVFCQTMKVEAAASANHVSSVSASAIERGAEQFALAMIDQQKDQVFQTAEQSFYGIQLGDGYFWFIRPNYGDDQLPSFGFIDEAAKVNLNTATLEMLLRLPGMTDDLAAAIMDWRDEDSDVATFGAENEYYLSLPDPYYCKNAALEAVEEMLLVRGATVELLYGQNYLLQGVNRELANSASSDPQLARGLYDLLTVYSIEPATATTTGGQQGGGQNQQPRRGLINVNNAPADVLYCIPGLDEADVSNLLSARGGIGTTSGGDISWVASALPGKAASVAQYITGNSYQYSVNILAVSGNGRAFKHVRIVIDARTTPAVIMFRKDLTDQGWPLDQETLQALRRGQGVQNSGRMTMGGSL